MRGNQWCSLRVALGCVMMVSSAALARQQPPCEPEFLKAGPAVGIDLNVYEMVEWDPDGSGPKGTSLIAAGLFQNAGAGPANSIAEFDGNAWKPMGAGLSLSFSTFKSGFVYALAVFEGELYAAGWFDLSGTTPIESIAKWTGTEWVQVGQGFPKGKVNDLVVYNGKLHAIGVCYDNGAFAPVARLDGSKWTLLFSGLEFQAFKGVEYKGDLYVAGDYQELNGVKCNGLVKFNGSTWSVVPGSPASSVGNPVGISAIGVYKDELVAGGVFDAAGGQSALNIARFDGSTWKPLGTGVDNQPLCMREFNGQLWVGGSFWNAGGVPVNLLARWDGTTWSPAGNELPGVSSVLDISVYRGEIVASSIFDYQGGLVGRLSGGQWRPIGLGFNSNINTITPYEDGAVAVGSFVQTPDGSAKGVARWDGESWAELGGGLNATGYTATTYNQQLIIGGEFTKAGSTSANRVARFDGQSWKPMGPGFNDGVFAFGEHLGQLYAGGPFTKSGTTTTSRLARWTGAVWTPVGSGETFNQPVFTLASYKDELYAGGTFGKVGGTSLLGIARFNGTTWGSVGGGVDGVLPFVFDLEVFQNQLVVAGTFDGVGNLPGTIGIARWDGMNWSSLAQGLGFATNGFCYTLTTHNGELFAGGQFDGTPSAEINAIARWDGQLWQPLGEGTTNGVKYSYNEFPLVRTLASARGELLIGGVFTSAGGKTAGNWGRWGCATPACPADCDGTGVLDINDFICVQTKFVLGDLSVDCDGSGQLNIDDFICFQTQFSLGC
jgi:trimeric autotransporter adhesin